MAKLREILVAAVLLGLVLVCIEADASQRKQRGPEACSVRKCISATGIVAIVEGGS